MVLNRIWIGMFLISGIVAFSKLIFWQDYFIFDEMVTSLFDSAKTGFNVAIGLTGMLCLWMGIMRIGEQGGAIKVLTRAVAPLFSRLFPTVPKDHPAVGSMMMNISANMLNLDNAATPMGLKAMKELQELNPDKEKATDAQIMFLVLNTSGLTLIPVSIFALLSSNHFADPTQMFLPILIATYCATLAGLIALAFFQKLNLFHPIVLLYLLGFSVVIFGLLAYVKYDPGSAEYISKVGGNVIIFLVIISFIMLAMRKKINVYDSFVDGAKEGFNIAISIVPYLVVILAGIAVLRGSGTLDAILFGVREFCIWLGVSRTEWVDALPVGLMKPLSGGGARGALQDMITTIDHHGQPIDVIKAGPKILMSLQTKIGSAMQGSTDTTFYVLALYFGSVRITNIRYAMAAGLIADLAGLIAAIIVSYIFFA